MTLTTISRKELFDILEHVRIEEVCDPKEDALIKMIAREILLLDTYEVEKDD